MFLPRELFERLDRREQPISSLDQGARLLLPGSNRGGARWFVAQGIEHASELRASLHAALELPGGGARRCESRATGLGAALELGLVEERELGEQRTQRCGTNPRRLRCLGRRLRLALSLRGLVACDLQ